MKYSINEVRERVVLRVDCHKATYSHHKALREAFGRVTVVAVDAHRPGCGRHSIGMVKALINDIINDIENEHRKVIAIETILTKEDLVAFVRGIDVPVIRPRYGRGGGEVTVTGVDVSHFPSLQVLYYERLDVDVRPVLVPHRVG